MKNLVTCKPTEFVRQTNRIKKSVEKWLTDTDIINIRNNMPQLEEPSIDATVEERAEILAKNKKLIKDQSMKNLSLILDAMLDEHPDETLEVLALICFVEPKDVDKHSMDEYLQALSEMMTNKAVVGFFTSLVQLEQMSTLSA